MRVLDTRPTDQTTDNKTRALELVQRAASALHRQLHSRFKSASVMSGPEATKLAARLIQETLDEHEAQRPPRRSSFLRALSSRLDAELLEKLEAHQIQLLDSLLEGASPAGAWSFTTPRKAAAKLGVQLVSMVRQNPDRAQRVLLLSLFSGGQSLPQVARTLGLENHQEPLSLAILDLSERLVAAFPQEANGWIQGLKGRPLSPPPAALREVGQDRSSAPERWVMALSVIGKRDPEAIAKSTGLKPAEVLEILDRQGTRSWGQTGPFGFDRAAFARTLAGTDLADYVSRVCGSNPAKKGNGAGNPDRWDLTNSPLKSTACWVLSLFLELGRGASRSPSSLTLPDRAAFESELVKALTPLVDKKYK